MENLNLNKTTSNGMSPAMEAVLNRYVLEANKTRRKYTKFGQKVDIPKGTTKTVAFDKLSPLPKATTALTEGVTPKGAAVSITRIKGEPTQYGNYVSYTDQLDFFANDPSPEVLKYTDLLTENQLETFEHLDAMTLASGTNVFYAGGVAYRGAIVSPLTVKDIRRAVTSLKRNKVQPADGTDYIAFVHPNVVYHIYNDEEWRQPHTYKDTKQLYDGEIGRLYGVRFIEDPDAFVNYGPYIAYKFASFTVDRVNINRIYIRETLSEEDAALISDVPIIIDDKKYTVTSATAGADGTAYLTIDIDVSDKHIVQGMEIHPGEGSVNNEPIYSTIIVGKNAFGTAGDKSVEIINKSLGSAGTSDPLNQRGTVGWKGYRFFKILEQTKMVRIESTAKV